MQHGKFAKPLWLSLFALGSLACKPTSSEIPLDKLQQEESGEEKPDGEARESLEPLPVTGPVDLLSSDVAFLAEAIDPAAVFGLLGSFDKYPDLAPFRDEARATLGGDVLDPNQWAQLGLDGHRPAGWGMFDPSSSAMFVYISLTDEKKFEQTIYNVVDRIGAREAMSSLEVGDAKVYRFGDGASIVVREQIALLIYVGTPERANRDYVVTAATIDPRESLGHSERFTWARAQVTAADDGMMFVNPSVLLRQLAAADAQNEYAYGIRYAEDALAQARANKEAPERIRELEARVAEERVWQQEREAQAARERKLGESLAGSIHAFVGAAEVRRDGVIGHARALMPNSGLLRRLLVTPERESPLLTALSEPPLFVLDGRVDLQVLLELIGLVAEADGEALDSINDKIHAEIGVDVIGKLIPALDGEGGFALTQARKPDSNRLNEVSKSIGAAGHVGLRDPEAIRTILDALARHTAVDGKLTRAKRGDGWTLAIPDWFDVNLSIVGDRLVFATDSKFTTRVRDAERGSQADAIAKPEHPLRGMIPTPSARLYGSFTAILLVDARAPYKQDAESMIYDFNTHHSLTPEEAAKVERSKAYKKKLKEFEKIIAELDAITAKREKASFESSLAMAQSLGDFGLQAEVVTDGVGLTGQWRFAPGMTPLELFAKGYGEQPFDWSEVEQVNQRMYVVLEELRAIRQADLDAAAAKRAPSPSPVPSMSPVPMP